MTQLPSVLFICLGNICRSPLAEAALRSAADGRGVSLQVDSAGIGGWHAGEAPDPRAQQVARAHGIDIGHYRARQVHRTDFVEFDHLVALDLENLAELRRLRPSGARARLSLLLDHVPGRAGQPVADPYYGGPEGFLATWADVTAGANGLLAGFLRQA
ncbi:low molecular weight phosphotyrosine protein phosphatase [Cereibacter azotoformans]|uniref:protein-tyrosine-phosphatase n=1 Tax=Cereibacter azotoformans TaxID=43057 RepID=A0A2T5KA93_9RHOB|nr:low molecular weight protein-tyrosine-phosphatase [Cereibacter azotoformans]AXQ95267.1 low molecular weight phosphotyrosine protein phosphatase [Cereibacter sphaeroides]PTR19309.1 protein-tyrosine phosphatase [Cereibacter azotoformans]UIJ32515.1 low molecular weight phosphotyrosine protein phosphatase [Cereibacter azotoformans]ULB11571.1 low molecular weight phosphotyrosine protein phosphatase [Cereibacter azotoformans]